MVITQGVKVPVASLIKAIEKKREKLESDYVKAQAKFVENEPAWRDKVVRAVQDLLAVVETGDLSNLDYTNCYNGNTTLQVHIKGTYPSRPLKPVLANLDRDLGLLRLSSDTDILVRTDSQWGQYL